MKIGTGTVGYETFLSKFVPRFGTNSFHIRKLQQKYILLTHPIQYSTKIKILPRMKALIFRQVS